MEYWYIQCNRIKSYPITFHWTRLTFYIFIIERLYFSTFVTSINCLDDYYYYIYIYRWYKLFSSWMDRLTILLLGKSRKCFLETETFKTIQIFFQNFSTWKNIGGERRRDTRRRCEILSIPVVLDSGRFLRYRFTIFFLFFLYFFHFSFRAPPLPPPSSPRFTWMPRREWL